MPILFQKSKIALKTSKYIPQKNEKITQKNQNNKKTIIQLKTKRFTHQIFLFYQPKQGFTRLNI